MVKDNEQIQVLKSRVNTVTYTSAVFRILSWANLSQSRYVCVANVHVVMEANDSSDFAKIISNADMVTPDGVPLVWVMRLKGRIKQERVYGPTLMLHILETAAQENIPTGFYGGSSEVVNALAMRMHSRFPGLNISFSYSPPFYPLTPEEDADIVRQIRDSGARILFVGLGCPKQERWMADHYKKLQTVMIGVGAAFDFHSGVKAQAPNWMQNNGLEWLFRLAKEPRRLWRRYLYYNPRFILLAIADLLKWAWANNA